MTTRAAGTRHDPRKSNKSIERDVVKAGDGRTFDAGSAHFVALRHVRQHESLDIAHAYIRMTWTAEWTPAADIRGCPGAFRAQRRDDDDLRPCYAAPTPPIGVIEKPCKT